MRFRSLEEILVSASENIQPPERLTVSEAAEKYRVLNNPGSYVGPWDNSIAPYAVEPMDVLTSTEYTGMIFAGPARSGKALTLDTPLPTPTGWTTIGEVRVGDDIFGDNGEPVKVIAKSEVFRKRAVYRVTLSDGSYVDADSEHLWEVRDGANQNETRIVNTEHLSTRVTYRKNTRFRYRIRNVRPVQHQPNSKLPLDPYILGLWLGDGHGVGARLASSAQDVEATLENLAQAGCPSHYSNVNGKHTIYLRPEGSGKGNSGTGPLGVSKKLKDMGLIKNNKHVPEEYTIASVADRRALLQGLLDSDGYVSPHGEVEFCNTNERIVSAVEQILRSLGVRAHTKVKDTGFKPAYNVRFSPYDNERYFRLERKQERIKPRTARGVSGLQYRTIVSVERLADADTQCIQVSAKNGLFVAGKGYVVTHNSDLVFNWIGHSAICDPADMMMVMMTQNTARDWSMGDLRKMFRHSPEIGKRVLQGRAHLNVHDINFMNGMRLLVKWPTISELSGKTIPRLWLADYDRMPTDVDKEGSPYALAKKRTQTFGRYGMTVAESSPGYSVTDPKWRPSTPHEAPHTEGILALYNRGDRRRYYWRCFGCNEPFEPDFSLLQWPDSQDFMEAAQAAMLHCPHCGQAHSHGPTEKYGPGKHALNQSGKWLRDGEYWLPDGTVEGTPPKTDTASFWLKGPHAMFTKWENLVYNYLIAEEEYKRTGAEELLKTTVNVDQGLPYMPKSAASERVPEELQNRAKDLGEQVVPEGVRFLVAAVDVQKNRFVVQVTGVGEHSDLWIVDRFEIKKSERMDDDGERYWVNPGSYPEDWDLLIEDVILKTYPLGDGSGRHMHIKAVACDSGGREGTTKNAYDFWRRLRDDPRSLHRRFQLVKGSSRKESPRVKITYPDTERANRNAGARGEIPVLFMNTDVLKDQLNNMLERTEKGGGMISFPNWLGEWFFHELTVEKKTAKGWENPRRARNEAWDLLVYALALLLSKHVRIEQVDWSDPPVWASEWDTNALVIKTEQDNKFDATPEKRYSLSELAMDLG